MTSSLASSAAWRTRKSSPSCVTWWSTTRRSMGSWCPRLQWLTRTALVHSTWSNYSKAPPTSKACTCSWEASWMTTKNLLSWRNKSSVAWRWVTRMKWTASWLWMKCRTLLKCVISSWKPSCRTQCHWSSCATNTSSLKTWSPTCSTMRNSGGRLTSTSSVSTPRLLLRCWKSWLTKTKTKSRSKAFWTKSGSTATSPKWLSASRNSTGCSSRWTGWSHASRKATRWWKCITHSWKCKLMQARLLTHCSPPTTCTTPESLGSTVKRRMTKNLLWLRTKREKMTMKSSNCVPNTRCSSSWPTSWLSGRMKMPGRKLWMTVQSGCILLTKLTVCC